MPRGRKKAVPAAEQEPEVKTYTLTETQFNSLKEVSEMLGDARRELDTVEYCETFQAASYRAGKAYMSVDRVEDAIDAIINSFDEDLDWEDDDDDM
jgi:DNA-binding PadR family transcriptional regulator